VMAEHSAGWVPLHARSLAAQVKTRAFGMTLTPSASEITKLRLQVA
jgi:hypothetical protein